MARTAIPVQTMPKHGGGIDDITFTAADATNDHEFANNGHMLLLMQNTSGGPLTADIIATDDIYGRAVDETITCGNGETCIYGPFIPGNWNQAGGLVNLDLTTDTNVSFAVVEFRL